LGLEFRNWNFYFNLINKHNMATITAADVNKLRTATGAGMMDCAMKQMVILI
jgi:hypothetical protein